MTPHDPDDAIVAYTVKELLTGIQTEQAKGFARIETSMSGKADKADVARMEARLDSHAQSISELQQDRRDRQRISVIATKVGGAMVGVGAILGGAAGLLSVLHVI